MNAKQYAWAYLMLNGRANEEPSFYGGYNVIDDNIKPEKELIETDSGRHYSFNTYRPVFLRAIREVGIDWGKTKAPVSNLRDTFNGTFAKSSQKEYLHGMLFLKDGSRQDWTSSETLDNVFQALAEREKYDDFFKSLESK